VNPWRAPRTNQWYWHGRWVGRVRAPVYYYPRGYAYRRWTAGLILPAVFLTSAYFYDSYAVVGLPPPVPGARWVRYGPDLLLVDLATGQVLDVAYGVFL
jgi:Ni/Co efflux regulator RcnB